MKTVSRPVVTLDGSRIILGVHEENTTISLRLPPKETRTLIDALIGALQIAWFAQGRESVVPTIKNSIRTDARTPLLTEPPLPPELSGVATVE